MAAIPPIPPLIDDPAGRPHNLVPQQATPMNPFFDQSSLPPGPITRWQGPGHPWTHHPAQESPLAAGTLSPLQFNPGWHQPPTSNRPWASPSQTSSTVVPPQWNGTPFLGPQGPIDPTFTGHTQSAQSESTAPSHPWNWARQWTRGTERSSASSVTSSPDSRDSPGDRALTPFLSRHDSVTTISSGFSKSSATTPVPSSQHQLALATGRPPQQWRPDFKMPRTGISVLMHRKKRSMAYPGERKHVVARWNHC